MKYALLLIVSIMILGCKSQPKEVAVTEPVKQEVKTVKKDTILPRSSTVKRIEKSDAEWKTQLSDMEYYVLREEGTERSFTSPLLKEKRKGIFKCKGCGLPLFLSKTKYKSGTGWPSFYDPINADNVHLDVDYKLGYARSEVECARCGGHLGHVFDDGPEPTGLRYCMNGVSLSFEPQN